MVAQMLGGVGELRIAGFVIGLHGGVVMADLGSLPRLGCSPRFLLRGLGWV